MENDPNVYDQTEEAELNTMFKSSGHYRVSIFKGKQMCIIASTLWKHVGSCGKKKMADIYTQELEEEQVRLDEVMSDRCAGGSRVR